MLDYFRKKLEILLDAVLAPVWQWVMAASWRTKVLILALLGAVTFVTANPALVLRGLKQTVIAYRVTFAQHGAMPFASATLESLHETTRRLSTTNRADLVRLTALSATAWSASQNVVASRGKHLDNKAVVAFIRSLTAPNCACWVELPEEKDAPHITFISGWVMTALATLDTPVTDDELQFALHSQSDDGSWHTFTVSDQPQEGSTYSTAWLVIGLSEQKRKSFIGAGEAQAVDGALTRAVAWLLSHRSGGARWKNYPDMTTSQESESISGLALHALHLAAPNRAASLDADWIGTLPERLITAPEGENNYVVLAGANARAIDHFVQFKLPWMLIATVDAYPQGDLVHRVRAMEWLEKSLNQPTIQGADAESTDWWRAELLYSLHYILDHNAPDHT